MSLTQEATAFQYLDFEEPIHKIQTQIDEMRDLEKKSNLDLTDKIELLQQNLEAEKLNVTQNLTTWQKVQLSRHPNRPYSLYYFDKISDSGIELHGDRNIGDDKAIVCSMAKIDGKSVMLIGHQKGSTTKLRQYRNFGMPNPEGYRKALRAMKMAEKFNIPIVTLIDTPGAFPGIEAEDRGQAEAIARNLFEMAKLTVPVLCYIIGEGASGGALGIGVGDRVFMLENTWFTVISPESCSSILWRTWELKERAAEALKLTPNDNLENKIIDEIVPEPAGGAHYNPEEMAKRLKTHILKNLTDLEKIDADTRITNRINRYSAMSTATEA
jgi:acetyl-CoA carboxylase carboxyl transferase subunit alpha